MTTTATSTISIIVLHKKKVRGCNIGNDGSNSNNTNHINIKVVVIVVLHKNSRDSVGDIGNHNINNTILLTQY